MRGKNTALVIGSLALSCLCPALAHADVHLAFGTKWTPLRYTVGAPDAYKFADTTFHVPVGGSGFQSTSLDPYIAAFFAQKYGAVLSLDIGYGSLSGEKPNGMMQQTTNNSFTQFGFSLGFKYYISQPQRSKVSPYLYADFFKYFASISTDTPNVGSNQAGGIASLLSPVGGDFAFGAEFFVTPAFSIGSEVLGLRVASAGGELVPATPSAGHTAESYTYLTFYTGISLNYRFQIAASVRSTDEETETGEAPPKPVKKVKKVQVEEETGTPPPPPPPSPEAVD